MFFPGSGYLRSESAAKYQVFLGGSCNPTTWRQDEAIPVLKSLGITYFNPVKLSFNSFFDGMIHFPNNNV